MNDYKPSHEQFLEVYDSTKNLEDFISICSHRDICHYPCEVGDDEKLEFIYNLIKLARGE
jgi:hypothetical protein